MACENTDQRSRGEKKSESVLKGRKRLMAYNWWRERTCEAARRGLKRAGERQTGGEKERVTKRGNRESRAWPHWTCGVYTEETTRESGRVTGGSG